jgi:hypothetical protein
MNPIETKYRNHKIAIRDNIEFASDDVTGKLGKQPVTKRVIEVDDVDVTGRCRVSNTDEEKTEAAKRFVDRIYPKGKAEGSSCGNQQHISQ